MNPTRRRESWRHKWCIHNTRTFLQNWHFSSAESGGDLQNKTCAAATAPSSCACCSALTPLALRGLGIYIIPDASNWLLHLLPSLIWSRATSGAQEASGSSSKQQIKEWDLLKNNPAETRIWAKANSLFHVETLFWFPAWLGDDRGILCKVTQTWKVHNRMWPGCWEHEIRRNHVPWGSQQVKPCFPLNINPPLWILASFDWGGGCQPCLAPPMCPTSAPTGSRAAKQLEMGVFWRGKWQGEKN